MLRNGSQFRLLPPPRHFRPICLSSSHLSVYLLTTCWVHPRCAALRWLTLSFLFLDYVISFLPDHPAANFAGLTMLLCNRSGSFGSQWLKMPTKVASEKKKKLLAHRTELCKERSQERLKGWTQDLLLCPFSAPLPGSLAACGLALQDSVK